jgi:hypothetical protein
MTTMVRCLKSGCAWYCRPVLSSERKSRKKENKQQMSSENLHGTWYRVPEGGLIPGETGRLTVGHKITFNVSVTWSQTVCCFLWAMLEEFQTSGVSKEVSSSTQYSVDWGQEDQLLCWRDSEWTEVQWSFTECSRITPVHYKWLQVSLIGK